MTIKQGERHFENSAKKRKPVPAGGHRLRPVEQAAAPAARLHPPAGPGYSALLPQVLHPRGVQRDPV